MFSYLNNTISTVNGFGVFGAYAASSTTESCLNTLFQSDTAENHSEIVQQLPYWLHRGWGGNGETMADCCNKGCTMLDFLPISDMLIFYNSFSRLPIVIPIFFYHTRNCRD